MPSRTRDYAILLAVTATLTLPYLGGVSLWDVDEAVNAQAAREMRDANTWVIPTFNYQLRTAKPVMLYWLQRVSYAAFGVNEWSARFPSVIASWLIVLLTYELTRRMFGRSTALLAGVVLASVSHFAVLAHAATPDATLLLFTTLTYLAFWSLHQNGSRAWWIPTAAACGLATLTKGPVGIALPGFVIVMYFAWNRELGRLLDRRLFVSAVVFVFVAVPWYALVASETRGEWLTAFFGNENVNRFLNPMEGHRGALWYYPGSIMLMFIPWSAFIIAAVWYGVKATREPNPPTPFPKKEGGAGFSPSPLGGGVGEGSFVTVRANRLLVCWVVAYLAFFTVAATKLPNYVFPVYPALAILIARFLVAWRDAELTVPRWLMPAGAFGLLIVGAVVAGGLLVGDETFPGLGRWAAIGIVPAIGGVGMVWCLRQERRNAAIQVVSVTAIAFVALLVTWTPRVLERQRAPRELVRATGLADPTRDVRIATFEWFQPSVVFYTGREVGRLNSSAAVGEFLAVPTPGYVFVPAPVWDELAADLPGPRRVIARHHDFLRKCDVVVVTNVPSADVATR
ncbi:MAG: glycosyltransferase family 39 protein [Planctomycetes bacterium]|nr:glycosyltransferase family 39 protein [Planctomycetota bacterium]